MRMARYDDLMAVYENPIEHACDLHLGQVFYVENIQKPEGLSCNDGFRPVSFYVEVVD